MIVGTTALILGVQSFFAAFLLSVIAGNEAISRRRSWRHTFGPARPRNVNSRQ